MQVSKSKEEEEDFFHLAATDKSCMLDQRKKNACCTRGVCVALEKLLSLSLKLEEQGPKTISFP